VKLSDFRNLRENDTFFVAEVCVTTGIWPFRKTITRSIVRQFNCNWVFSDTWKFTPGNQAEVLEREYIFQKLIADRIKLEKEKSEKESEEEE